MAINFPPNPTPNETHTDAGRTWKWDGTSWRLEGNASNYTHPDHTGDVTSNADGATTIADDKVEEKHINAGGTVGADKVLVYDSNEATNWKWADQSGSGGLQNVVEDTTPQLGGNLDVNGQDIVSTSNGDIDLDPNGTGNVVFKGNATKGSGQFKLNCENNSHGITIKGPPHSAAASYTLTLPNDDGNVNQVLSTNGSGLLDWVDQTASGATSLNALTDVNAGSPTDGHVLKWQASTSKWIAAADLTATGGSGITLTDLSRTNATPGSQAKLDYDNTTGVFTYTPLNMDPWVKVQDTTSTTISRTGSSYLTLTSDFYIQLVADQYVRLDGNQSVNINSSTGPLSVSVAGGITLSGGGIVQLQGTRVDFRDTSSTRYAFFDPSGLNLLTSGIKDKDGNLGTSGQILSTTGTSVDWIDAPAGGVTDGDKGAIVVSQSGLTWTLDAALTELSDVSVSSPSNGQVLKYNGTNWINDTDATNSTAPGGSSGQFQFNSSNSFAGSDILLSTSGTSHSGSTSPSLTLSGDGTGGWGYGNITWEPSVGCLSLTRDSFLIFGSPDNSTISMKASIGWASSVDRWIMNNPTDGMPWHFETRGNMVFKKQNGAETVHMVIDPDDGVEIKNQLDLTTATIIDKDGQAGSSGQILSSTATGIDWINAPGATSLDGLSDTNINTSNLANEQILQYNGSKWVNATVSLGGTDNYVNGGSWSSSNGQLTLNRSGGLSDVTISVSNLQSYFDTRYSTTTGASTLNDLNDTTIASPQNNQLLQWNGSKWVNATVSLGGTDTNNYVNSASWSSSTGQLTLGRGGTSSLSNITCSVSNLEAYFNTKYSTGGISISGSPSPAGAVIRWNGSGWEWSRTALIDGGTSSNNTNLTVHNNTSGYGGMVIDSGGQVLLRKAGTSYREGGHLQFEDHTFSSNDDTFAIDVYSDNGTNAECCIRIIDQESNTQRFSVNHDGAWGIGHTNPDYGSIGEVMISRGSSLPPVWGNHGDISGSAFATTAQGATADTANAEIDHIYSQLNAIGNDDTITTVAQLKTALLALVRN